MDTDNKTPNTQREETRTSTRVGEGVGDSKKTQSNTTSSNSTKENVDSPSGVNKEVWEQARSQVKDTFGGLDEKAQKDAIQARYDSMVASDENVKKWAGGDAAILGDIGQDR